MLTAEPALSSAASSGAAAERRVYAATRQTIMDHRLEPGTKLKKVAIAAHDTEQAVAVMRAHVDHLERELNLHRPEPPKTLTEIFAQPA